MVPAVAQQHGQQQEQLPTGYIQPAEQEYMRSWWRKEQQQGQQQEQLPTGYIQPAEQEYMGVFSGESSSRDTS